MRATVIEAPDDTARRRTGGRPTRLDAAHRDERLLATATALFMERGFDATSIEAVAEAAGVGKQTVYSRYGDKSGLFVAVLRLRIESWLAPIAAIAEAHAASSGPRKVGEALHELSRSMLEQGLAPEARRFTRILVSQSEHFPEVAVLAYEEGWRRAVRAVALLLQEFAARGLIEIEDAELAADLFISLTLGRCKLQALYGLDRAPEEREKERHAAVELFLRAVRPLPLRPHGTPGGA